MSYEPDWCHVAPLNIDPGLEEIFVDAVSMNLATSCGVRLLKDHERSALKPYVLTALHIGNDIDIVGMVPLKFAGLEGCSVNYGETFKITIPANALKDHRKFLMFLILKGDNEVIIS